ncbi:MAG: hypothetical protein QRY72_04340 [Candidatus Rhabdochlamydia sp.]
MFLNPIQLLEELFSIAIQHRIPFAPLQKRNPTVIKQKFLLDETLS